MLKFQTFHFEFISNKILVIWTRTYKMLVSIANSAAPDLGLCFLSRPFWQATSIQNFRTFTVLFSDISKVI